MYEKLNKTEKSFENSLAFLYTTNKRSDRWETISFTIASKRIKYLGINLPKEAKDLFSETYKILMKKNEITPTDGEIVCSWIEKNQRWENDLGFPGGSDGKKKKKKKSAYSAGTQIKSLGQEDLLEKWMATHSSILAWRIPCTEEPSGLQSMGLQRTGHDSN